MVKIGDIPLGNFPLLLAPMEDVSDPPFRALCKENGADVVYTEFISSEGLIRDAAKSVQKLDIYENLESLYANVEEKTAKKEDYELKMMTEIIDMCLQFEQLVENNTSDQDDAFLLESTKKNIQKLTKIADIKNI